MASESKALLSNLLGLLLLVVVGALVLANWKPPEPEPATAAADVFSAVRAQRHVETLGRAPRPLGSEAHAEAREYLMAELRTLGLEPQIQEASIVVRRGATGFLAAKVQNVLTRLPGRESSGAVLLLAHYDSRPNTQGAGDALSAVATLLETLRVLTAGPQLDNDLIVLFSDGEELALLGARTFADEHPWASDVRLVLNFEARGNRGPSPMFETRSGNLDVVRDFAEAAPYPFATSLTYEVYRRMPNDSDYSVFRDAGIQGLNMAFIGNLAAYHTRLDSPANLNLGSLQHQGSYAVSLTRHFGVGDLGRLQGPDGADAVYFNPWPWKLVVYPASLAVPIAVGAILLLVAALVLGRRQQLLTTGGVVRGLGFFVTALVAAGLAGWCFWWFIRTYLPGLRFGPYGEPYEIAALTLSLVLLVVGLVGMLAGWFRAGSRSLELWTGVWLGWAILSLAVAVVVPGVSYLVSWPVLIAALGGVILAAKPALANSDGVRGILVCVLAVPAVVLFAPTIWLLVQAMTFSASAAVAVAAALALTSAAPALGRLQRTSGSLASWALAVAGVTLLAWTAWKAGPTAERPAVNTLAYAVDTESGEAWWTSFDRTLDEWTAGLLGEDPERDWAPSPLVLPDTQVWRAPTDPAALRPPSIELLVETRDPSRSVVGSVRSMRGAGVLRVRAEASVPFNAVSVEGERFDYGADDETEGVGEAWITAYGYGEEGVRLGFELEGDNPWPVELDLVDQSWRFDALPDPPPARPPHLIPSSSWRTDSVYVRTSALL